jgi:NAD(P)-dependent dehydrogenase (short-subunit alcohol dehydrogenase family)
MLENKTVLITGGAGRLGLPIAKKILDEGGNVIVLDNNKKSIDESKDILNQKKSLSVLADANDPKEIDICIQKIIKKFRKFDTAIHSAYPRSKGWGTKFEDLEKDFLNQDLNQQLGGAILFSQRVLRYFKSQGHGNLIHISSIQGLGAPKFEHYKNTSMVSPIEYTAIKAGIIAITKYLSKYYRNSNVRVNSISPGGILDSQQKIFLKKYRASCNDKGMLEVSDLLGTIIFLISDQSRYINGQNIIVDDGWSL